MVVVVEFVEGFGDFVFGFGYLVVLDVFVFGFDVFGDWFIGIDGVVVV